MTTDKVSNLLEKETQTTKVTGNYRLSLVWNFLAEKQNRTDITDVK